MMDMSQMTAAGRSLKCSKMSIEPLDKGESTLNCYNCSKNRNPRSLLFLVAAKPTTLVEVSFHDSFSA